MFHFGHFSALFPITTSDMKKLSILTALSIGGLLMASCGLQEPVGGPQPDEGTKISATLVSVQSKTWLDYASGGSPLKVYWSDGDKLNVNGQTSLPLSIAAGEKISDADFLLSNIQAPYRAIYPSYAVTEEGYAEDGSIAIQLPAVQKYLPSSFANGAAIMYGYSESEDGVTLQNLCAVVRVNIKGSGDNIVSAKLVSSSDDAPLCGDFRLTPADGSLETVNGNITITLEMDDKVSMNNEAGTDFFFAIPAGDYSKGLSFYFKRESDSQIMQNIWRPTETLHGGRLYSFNNIDFEATAKEIETEAQWNEFAAACNNGGDISKYLFKDDVVRIGADITAENLTSIAEFDGVLDGNGYTLTRTAASEPLFASLTGEVRNLALGGNLKGEVVTVDERPTVACAPLVGSLDGGKISGCINNMTVSVGTMSEPVEAHMYVSGLVSVMTAGTIEKSVNNASVDVSVNVHNTVFEVTVAGIVADVRVSDIGQKISLNGCSNKGALTLAPYLEFKSAAATRDKGMKVCGFGGVAGWLRSEGSYEFTDCNNQGNITVDGHNIKHSNGNTPYTIAVGGVLGLAAPCPEGFMKLDEYEKYDLTLTRCSNTGGVYNYSVNYSSTTESNNKVFTGGLAGAVMGTEDSHAKVTDCESKGIVITYDYTPAMTDVEVVSGRPQYCAVAGGLVGFGGYLDIERSTIACQIGNGKRQMVAWGGVIGFAMRPFSLKNSTLDVTGYFQRIEAYKMNRAVVAVVPVKYNATAMKTVPNVNGSVIEGCTIGCLLWTSSTYSAASATSIDPATLTLDVFNNKMRDNLVCGQGFTANEGITIGNDSGDNNTYL